MKLLFIFLSSLITSAVYASGSDSEYSHAYRTYLVNSHFHKILTDIEQAWIKENPVASVAGDANLYPIEGFNRDNEYVGIEAEILKLLSQKSGLIFKPLRTETWRDTLDLASQQTVDIISGSIPNPVIEKNYRATHVTINKPIVMVASGKMTYISNLNAVKDLRIALLGQSGYANQFFEHYPNINFITIDNIEDLLFGIEKGKYDIALLSMPVASYQISEFGLYDLTVVGITDINLQLSLFVNRNKPMLWNIINELKKDETRQERYNILSKWVKYKFIDRYSPQRMRLLFVAITLIFIFLLYRHYLLKQQAQTLTLLSQTDKLTRLHNRLYLDTILEQKTSENERYQSRFSLIIIDIDYFKSVNDGFGHLVGDKFLIDFSALLTDFIRSSDIIGRWGGEEFLVVCPETKLQDASLLAEKLRTQVESFHFQDIGQKTISLGVAEFVRGETVDSCLARADIALFEAKEAGRNQVVIAQPSELYTK